MLPGANAVISVAEQTVPSGLAALLVASIPLWVILLRRASGERDLRRSIVAVLVGFGGVALLLKPEGEATIIGLLACIGARAHVGDRLVRVAADPPPARPARLHRLAEPARRPRHRRRRPGRRRGRRRPLRRVVRRARSSASIYLITFGSLLAFTCYAWLLQNAPISKVSTYAYVNPVVAIALGWLILDEGITVD